MLTALFQRFTPEWKLKTASIPPKNVKKNYCFNIPCLPMKILKNHDQTYTNNEKENMQLKAQVEIKIEQVLLDGCGHFNMSPLMSFTKIIFLNRHI